MLDLRKARYLANFALILAASTAVMPVLAQAEPSLEAEFRNPPPEARPRVWWHWLNGNITKDGIAKDLAWMKRIGIGGGQTFDINFSTPTVVDQRLIYMTPPWKDAFRFAAREADRLGLELTVAASPGWSETGGPWVKPEDGMKKLVWSVTDVAYGAAFGGRLSAPPFTTGPWQDLPLTPEPGAEAHPPPQYYADVAVLAYPISLIAPLSVPRMTTESGAVLDAARLSDGKYVETVSLPRNADGGEASVLVTFDQPQAVRSLNLFSNGNTDRFNGATFSAVLEVKGTGGDAWTRISEFTPALVPSTISFAPVIAAQFRLRFVPRENLSAIDAISAPGYAGVNYSQFLRARPLQFAELRLSGEPRINRAEEKAGFDVARDYQTLDKGVDGAETGISPSGVIDLTAKMRADGTVDWKPPRGNWRIVRFGTSLIGKTNHPAPAEATGLEVDKMDGAAVRRYMEHYLRTYRDTVGGELMGARGINAILTDSTEVGAFNWTPAMREQFRRRRGYDLLRWLPALSGEIVGSRGQSDRFLYDFRRTIGELHASEHYGTIANVAHANGLKVYGEALEGWRVSLGDDIDMRSGADIPMAALWAFPRETGPRPLLLADLRTAASAAHLAGKRFVAAESMTSSRFPWAHSPADLRRIVDTEFAHGINRIVIHTSPHQPVDDKQPGLSLRHIGQFFTRHETWAEMAKPWTDYIARSSYLLQQGRNVADVAYFLGEDAPAGTLIGEGALGDVPRRYAYDFVNATAILKQFRVENGELVTAGGARYRVLYLGGSSQHMTLPVLRRIRQLVQQGATVVGAAPLSSPSLADDPQRFATLVREMWPDRPAARLGKGRVISGKDVEGALAAIDVRPDFEGGSENIDFAHRQLADGHIYFVRNASTEASTMEASFRVSDKAPELWDAVTGESRPLSYRIESGQTLVPLSLPPEASRFVVFRKPAFAQSLALPEQTWTLAGQIERGWSVAFQTGRGAPERLGLPNLSPLNENSDPGIRYFSGVATYSTTFIVPAEYRPGQPLLLDLGKIGDLAEIRVNGRMAGTVWAAPYRLDIARLVQAGSNNLEVRVANLWHNRLIGDAQPGASKIAWTASPMYKADTPLLPSGLIGPVTILTSRGPARGTE